MGASNVRVRLFTATPTTNHPCKPACASTHICFMVSHVDKRWPTGMSAHVGDLPGGDDAAAAPFLSTFNGLAMVSGQIFSAWLDTEMPCDFCLVGYFLLTSQKMPTIKPHYTGNARIWKRFTFYLCYDSYPPIAELNSTQTRPLKFVDL